MMRSLARLFRRYNADRELKDEIAFHLEMRARLHETGGTAGPDARALARRQFGNVSCIEEDLRHMHVNEFVESFFKDVRYALRGFARQPAFTVTALAAIILGIGASTAVFSVVDRVLFRSLPYPDEDRLVSFGLVAPIEPNEFMLGADYYEWRVQETPFSAMTSWSGTSDCDLTENAPVRVTCAAVEASFLSTLGVNPLLGRAFTTEEDRPSVPRVALLGYGLWRSRYAANPNVVGTSISIDEQPVRIVGVLPADFELPNLARADLLVPQALNEAAQRHPATGAVLRTFARLKPGITVPQAEGALQPLFRQALNSVPPAFRKEVRLRVRTLRDRQMAGARSASWILWAAVTAVLLIACGNVANLLLARAASRERELTVRAALGGSRSRLLRQSFTESLVLSLLGAVPGCALALILLRTFVSLAPQAIPGLDRATVDTRVLFFTLGASLASAMLFGLAPALGGPRAQALTTQRTVSAPRQWVRQTLIAAQIAASLVLLTGAGLLLRSLWRLENAPLGLDTEHLLTVSAILPQQTTPERRYQFAEDLESRLRRMPGVTAAAVADSLPPAGNTRTMIYSLIEVEGRPKPQEGTGGMVVWRAITPEYFHALGVRIAAGRAFDEGDRQPNTNSIVLSDTLARRLFGSASPIGTRVRLGRVDVWYTVVGVAQDVRNAGLKGPQDPEYYLARKHEPDLGLANRIPPAGLRGVYAVVRTGLGVAAAAQLIRSEVAEIFPTLPVLIEPMSMRVRQLAQAPRFNALLLALFAAIAITLAAIGLYGVVAFMVAQRTQEIGVRMALGASPANVIGLVLRSAGAWTLAGIGIGLVASWSAARSLRTLLYEVPEHDPSTFAAAAGLLLATALLAAWLPSRRAAAVDPMTVLRQE